MKRLHRRDLFTWSVYSEKLDVDFSGFAWIRDGREGGNVLVDPVPMNAHDRAHLAKLGGAGWIVLTNGDHVRAARELASELGAKIAAPAAERETLQIACDRWLGDGDELLPGLVALALDGSKTPGELALVLDETTLICGDLVRAHRAGSLMLLLPEQGMKDRAKAAASVARLHALPKIEAVLVGDGWSVFRDGRKLLGELAASLAAISIAAFMSVIAIACAAPPSPPIVPPLTEATPLTPATASSAPAPSAIASTSPSTPRTGAQLVTTPCVLHAGEAKRSARKIAHSDASTVVSASCWYNAECFAHPGQSGPGDGFVSVKCDQTACECEWSGPNDDPPIREAFTIDALPSGSGDCRSALLNRCMIGMKLYSSDAGADSR